MLIYREIWGHVATVGKRTRRALASVPERSDSMEILLSHESVKQVWDARDRASLRALEHVGVTGPSAKEAESWALQPG